MSGSQQLVLAEGAGGAEKVYIEDVFSTWLYTGNGSTQTITNGIDLAGKGGLVWIKNRISGVSHGLYDTNRGAYKWLASDRTDVETTQLQHLTSFNNNGFSLGSSSIVNGSIGGATYASWTFRKQPKFFDVVTYVGDGTTNRTVAHNLGSTPGCVICKATDASGTTYAWGVWHRGDGTTAYSSFELNGTQAATTDTQFSAFTSTTFKPYVVNNYNAHCNQNGVTYVAYLFAHNAGGFGLTGTDNVISCGSFTAAGSTTDVTVNLGYEPQWLLVKVASTNDDWYIYDVMRGMSYTSTTYLRPSSSGAEVTFTTPYGPQPTATGFIAKNSLGWSAGETLIYIAIRRGPMKTPTTGTSVFNPVANSNNIDPSNPVALNPFASDLWLNSDRSSAAPYWLPRLAGWGYMRSSGTAAEINTYTWTQTTQSNLLPNLNWWSTNPSQVNYFFKRAPGFFDVVCYTGTGSVRTVSHNLGVAPELFITKSRGTSGNNWSVYSRFTSTTYGYQTLQTDSAGNSARTYGPGGSPNFEELSAAPTASVINLASSGESNFNGRTFVAYLFASCPGVSKVGTYTGTGNTLQIDCGFTGGARFVLIKRTDSNGDWYVWDSARGIVSGNDPYLLLNTAAAEVTNTDWVDTHSPGFELSNSGGNSVNISTATYIFLAIA